jgi:thioredoxin-like negative regulator of GroEL
MLFEPLFATDYFASQGIKLSDEMQSSDKLGKQLKSFTEWLKTIKKTHNYTPPEPKQVDQNVAQLAEKSNIETEVITEAMAEVYLQQGKISKANEVYEKLSLQNPAKNTYFAGKIENLKAK